MGVNGICESGYMGMQMSKSVAKETEKAAKSFGAARADALDKAQASRGSRTMKTESVVDKYRRNHPDDVSHVNSQVNAGKKVISRNNAEHVNREEMTMEEYKAFFNGLLDSIPFHPTRRNDIEIMNISEEGWEQMKGDPEYEAWILGYTVENRSVENPFAGMNGNLGIYYTESFGASIEEHHGQGFTMSGPASRRKGSEEDEESWWEKRHKRFEEMMEEAVQKAQARRKQQSAMLRQESLRDHLEGRQRLKTYFMERTHYGSESANTIPSVPVGMASAAASAYDLIGYETESKSKIL